MNNIQKLENLRPVEVTDGYGKKFFGHLHLWDRGYWPEPPGDTILGLVEVSTGSMGLFPYNKIRFLTQEEIMKQAIDKVNWKPQPVES